MRRSHHQRDRIRLHLTDSAMPRRVGIVRAVQEDVGEFVYESLHLGGVGHVLPHRHRLRTEISEAIGAVDHALVRHPHHGEPLRLNLSGDALPKIIGCFTFQQPW